MRRLDGRAPMTTMNSHQAWRLRTLYNMTPAQYEALLRAQGGRCAICPTTPEENGKMLAVDHDHDCCPEQSRSCGECVRGLLCSPCNFGVAHFRDNPDYLVGAIDYLSGKARRSLLPPCEGNGSISEAPPTKAGTSGYRVRWRDEDGEHSKTFRGGGCRERAETFLAAVRSRTALPY